MILHNQQNNQKCKKEKQKHNNRNTEQSLLLMIKFSHSIGKINNNLICKVKNLEPTLMV